MASYGHSTVIFVKKLLEDGQPCAKCRDIERRLIRDGLMACIDTVVTIDGNDPSCRGAALAARHGVERAPFFVVTDPEGHEEVIESYLAFKRRFSGVESASDLADAVDRHPDLAFI